MTIVTNIITDPGENPVKDATVRITLITGTNAPGYTSSGEVQGTYSLSTDATGTWSANLTPNSAITPTGTYYQVVEGRAVSNINVPASGGPYLLGSILVVPPTTPGALGITGVQVATGGTVAGSRPEINLIAGTNVTLSGADNSTNNRVDVTISASGGGAVTSVNGHTGTVVLAASDVGAVPTTAEGTAGGVATLDGNGHVPAAQGANFYSRQIEIAADGPASTVTAPVGTWTPTYLMTSDTGGVWSGWVNISDGTQNDSISFDFASAAGTFSIELRHLPFTNRGIYTIEVDGVSVGTLDGYAASLTAGRSVLTGVVLTAGTHVITLLMATKNASSSGYIGMVERLLLTRTA